MSGSTAARLGRAALDDDQLAFAESFGRFLADEADPRSDELHATGGARDVLSAAAEHGFLGMSVPEDDGGVGIDDVRFSVALAREAGRRGHSALGLLFAAHNDLATPLVVRFGTDELRARRCASLADGSCVGTLAAPPSTPDGQRPPQVTASPTVGGWRLEGHCDGVVGATIADLLVVLASTPEGDALLAVTSDSEGIGIDAGDGTLGARPAGIATISFDGVEVASTDLIGAVGGAEAAFDAVEPAWTLSLAANSLAAAGLALETTRDYVVDRRAFGQPIASFENTRLTLGAVAAEIAACGALFDQVATSEAPGLGDLAFTKLTTTEALMRAVDAGVQLHGGYGYMLEYPIARQYIDARAVRLLHPTSERCRALAAGTAGL